MIAISFHACVLLSLSFSPRKIVADKSLYGRSSYKVDIIFEGRGEKK